MQCKHETLVYLQDIWHESKGIWWKEYQCLKCHTLRWVDTDDVSKPCTCPEVLLNYKGEDSGEVNYSCSECGVAHYINPFFDNWRK